MNVPCAKCGAVVEEGTSFKVAVTNRNQEWHLCSRICLVEWIAPEVTKAIVVRQWVPTAEEEERMKQ